MLLLLLRWLRLLLLLLLGALLLPLLLLTLLPKDGVLETVRLLLLLLVPPLREEQVLEKHGLRSQSQAVSKPTSSEQTLLLQPLLGPPGSSGAAVCVASYKKAGDPPGRSGAAVCVASPPGTHRLRSRTHFPPAADLTSNVG